MNSILQKFLIASAFLVSLCVHAAPESALVPLKSNQALSYRDMHAFTYSGGEFEAMWLLVPPFLQNETDLKNALFQLNNRGMTAEILKFPLPQLPAPAPEADSFERMTQLHKTAALGLLSTVTLTADYGTALTAKLREMSAADPGLAKLRQKMLQLSFGKGSQALPIVPVFDSSKPKVYDESVPLAEAKVFAATRRLEDLEKGLRNAVGKRQLDLYEMTVSELLAIQEEGKEADGQAGKILNGYHLNGVLRGFPVDGLVDAALSTVIEGSWDAYDLIDLNKIIMLSGTSRDRSMIVAGIMLVRASVEKNPDDMYLVVSGVLKRLLNNESVDSLVLEISRLSYFGSTTDEVNSVLQNLLKLWKP